MDKLMFEQELGLLQEHTSCQELAIVRKWAQEQLRDSRFMQLPADLLRVLIHHVKDTAAANAIAEHLATEREQAKENAFVSMGLEEGTCAVCNYVGYSDNDNECYSLLSCPTCREVICLDCEKSSNCVVCEQWISHCAACANGCADCGEFMCTACIKDTYAHCGKCTVGSVSESLGV